MTAAGERVQQALQRIAYGNDLSTHATNQQIAEVAGYATDRRGRATSVAKGLRELAAAGLIEVGFDARNARTIKLTGPRA